MLAFARALRVLGLVGVVLAVGLWCWSASALAATGYAASPFGEPAGGFSVPVGVGVDESAGSLFKGDVYVSNLGSNTIDEFDAAGAYRGVQVEVSGARLYQLAVDSYPGAFEGDVFVAASESGAVYRFGPGLVGEQKVLSGLSEPNGVAVDEAGDLFVAQAGGGVLEFNGAGEPVDAAGVVDPANVVVGGLNGPQAVAVSASGDVLYVATASGTLQYTLTGGAYVQSATIDANGAYGVGVAPLSGDVFVDQGSEVLEYEPDGTQIGSLGEGTLATGFGVAVDGAGQVYVADTGAGKVYVFEAGETPAEPTTGQATVNGAKAVLAGTLNTGGGGITGYHFAYNAGGACQGGAATEAGVASSGAVQSETGELEPVTQYTFCLVATNKYGSTPGAGVSLETHSVPPEVTNESVSGVTSSAATLSAQIDPRKLQTTYQFEYSTDGTQWLKTPEQAGALSAEQGNTTVTTKVRSLHTSTAYRFRVTATNSVDEAAQGEGTFNTLPAGIPGLPDGRVYEPVSPAYNEGAEVYAPESAGEERSEGIPTEQLFQVAMDGNAVAYVGDGIPGESGEGIGGPGAGSNFLARRSANGGWTQTSILPPGYLGTEYEAFSSDLSTGMLASFNRHSTGNVSYGGALSPEAPPGEYNVLYSRVFGEDVYRPLFTMTPPNRANADGQFGHEIFDSARVRVWPGSNGGEEVVFAGASADFSQLLFEANDDLLQGAGSLESELGEDVKREVQEGLDGNYLYDSAGGQLSLIDVLPDGKIAPDATFGARGSQVESFHLPDFSHDISNDGQRVYWTDLNTGVVYMRVDGTSTVEVSPGSAQFWTAIGDGRYAFYTEGGGLYRFDIEHPQTPEALAGTGAGMEGVIGTSEDGEDVYFVASGALASGATAGQPNLYLARASGASAVTFIATLSHDDSPEGPSQFHTTIKPYSELLGGPFIGDWAPTVGYRTAEVTSDGGGLVFMSDQPLKAQGFPEGYANEGQEEVYVYDAADAKLFCASCMQSGESGGSGYLPISWGLTYAPQVISQDGNQVFFDSSSGLVSRDVNHKQDVYEWEREGAGSCEEGTGEDGGCVYLLSGGRSSSASWLLGASETGDDVFMITRAQLTPEADGELFHVDDARVGGVPPTPVACSGAACPGTPAPASGFGVPSSLTFSGAGNPLVSSGSSGGVPKPKAKPLTRAQKLAAALRVCRKRPRRARAVCEAQARKRYRPGKAKKASTSVKSGRR